MQGETNRYIIKYMYLKNPIHTVLFLILLLFASIFCLLNHLRGLVVLIVNWNNNNNNFNDLISLVHIIVNENNNNLMSMYFTNGLKT